MMEKSLRERLEEVVNHAGGKIIYVEKKMVCVILLCSNNHTFSNKPRSIINGHWCPLCNKNQNKSPSTLSTNQIKEGAIF